MLKAPTKAQVTAAYNNAKKQYALLGVNTDKALAALKKTPISLHCWQGDDVAGFEVKPEGLDGGGIMTTGDYPGRARSGGELRKDLDKVLSLLPGKHRVNVHALYAETDGKVVDRDKLEPKHFEKWMKWAKRRGVKLDFNPTFFAHPMAESGYTLSSPDPKIRNFWIRHAIASRKIAEAMGKAQGGPCYINHWVPDGAKDSPTNRWAYRATLKKSLDKVLAAKVSRTYVKDAVECKLFGIGSEDFVVGSHEFYTSYAMTTGTMLCLDMGHFHPTETIHDKLSAVLTFQKNVLLHVSRPIRWDSDHVVVLNDDVKNVFHELVRGDALDRAAIALDFFDASINRIGAWVTGTRAALKAILFALLEPVKTVQGMEAAGDGASKLAMLEEMKAMPFGAVWDYHCMKNNVPVGVEWINQMKQYEEKVTSKRG